MHTLSKCVCVLAPVLACIHSVAILSALLFSFDSALKSFMAFTGHSHVKYETHVSITP